MLLFIIIAFNGRVRLQAFGGVDWCLKEGRNNSNGIDRFALYCVIRICLGCVGCGVCGVWGVLGVCWG